MPDKLKVAVLISGKGTNLQALIDACKASDYPAEIVAVISNNPDAYGITIAKNGSIPTYIVNHKDFSSREKFDQALHTVITESRAEFICLAGFLRLLTKNFVNKWANRIINIHPSLLPEFKGIKPCQQAIEAGAKFSGCTVHFVSPEIDSGPIILQAKVSVYPDDDAKILAARILLEEHKCYPEALKMIAEGKV